MLDVIKRVISGDDMNVTSNEQQGEQQANNNVDSIGNTGSDSGLSTNFDTAPVLVENDMDLDQDVGRVAHMATSETPRSSLSDVSAAHDTGLDIDGDENMEDQDQSARKEPERGTLTRNDSKMSSDSSNSVRGGSQNSSRDWGWFEDVHASEHAQAPQSKRKATSDKNSKKGKTRLVPLASAEPHRLDLHPDRETDAAAMAVTAPNYVLEESLSSQRLWKDTAGQRPPQPVEERAFFEKMWAQNFVRSRVEYEMPVEVLTATTPISLSPFADGNFENDRGGMTDYNLAGASRDDTDTHSVAEAALISRLNDPRPSHTSSEPHHLQQQIINKTVKGSGSDGDLTVMVKGDNVFGTTVSKSFARPGVRGGPIQGVDTVNISVASYRVVESTKRGKYAQFLVIYREGSIRDTIGVWKRYSDFQELSKKVTQAHEGCAAVIANMSPLAVTEEVEVEHLPNAITSWRLLKKRQRWFRCLDAGYLSLKVFLLERFLHDILFESSSPNLLREFVGTDGTNLE
eukprot:CAMPEP_0117057456 /NCGR_PEP_ID=MMETSP0472-20121206/39897_1 /TAXON_ID=693140 ORGANISM="Tiarina fusus, Strain LIS" /NCGR_SAMPLE_ID=MMETSP0472 /ASSEMBLY_ACC=CAM_ASM_000603 /LENGTH=514 /DNA_ID=CAMNT_0004774365 /DNA_START=182 /DNA_END=1726 /DNA_ORIENTATION=+